MTPIYGMCQPRFSEVKTQFAKNFLQLSEIGASVCIMVGGETVAHLWSGCLDKSSDQQWNDQTVVNVFSSTKGALALSALMLIDSGELKLDVPVSHYWPAFRKQGKEKITVRMVLNHQAGLPAVRQALTLPELYDLEALPKALETEELFWEPGTQHGYHAITFGALIDELFRRITGLNVGTFFEKEVAVPLGADFWIGLPEQVESRVAPVIFSPPQPSDDQSTIPENGIAEYVRPALELLVCNINSRASRAVGFPAGGGIASALGLAKMYAPLSLDGSFEGSRIVSEEAILAMTKAQPVQGSDSVLPMQTSFVNGFTRSWGGTGFAPGQGFAIGKQAFGHPGMGGSIGFADPKHHLSFAYTMNRLNGLPSLDCRAQNLIDATYLSLGLENRKTGCWE